MKKLLVVGGTGFIGYHLLRRQKRKYQLFSISLNKPKKIRNILGVKYIFADISKYKVLKTKLNISFDYVINAGGYGNHPEFGESGDLLIKNHYQGLINLLRTLKFKRLKSLFKLEVLQNTAIQNQLLKKLQFVPL